MRNKKNKILVSVSLIVVFINAISFAKKNNYSNLNINTKIQRPIIELEKDELIKTKINEKSFPIEYNFCINNFKENEINEIECDYFIEIEKTEENFPINYKLIDCVNNQEIKLIDGKSQLIKMQKSIKESRKFKIVLEWKELNFDLADELKINLKLNIEQSKVM